jgi:hypothetical protein
MKPKTTFKCLHCNEVLCCEPRNKGRQRYCRKPECRRVSKAASQREWLSRPENENYFRGTENCERVRLWRMAHPGYWRNKTPAVPCTLQEPSKPQVVEEQKIEPPVPRGALQDVCFSQLALLVGLISMMTGHALQEDIAASVRALSSRGEDILRMELGSPPHPQFPNPNNPNYEDQTRSLPATLAARASPI